MEEQTLKMIEEKLISQPVLTLSKLTGRYTPDTDAYE